MSDVLLAAGIFAVAGAVQSLAGFGFGMVSMAILPVILPVRSAVLADPLHLAPRFSFPTAGVPRMH